MKKDKLGDYVAVKGISEFSAKELLSLAKEFLESAKKYLSK